MTATNNNELRSSPPSRRTSVAEQGAVSDSGAGSSSSRRPLPPRPAGPRSPERSGSIHTSVTVTPYPAPTDSPSSVAPPAPLAPPSSYAPPLSAPPGIPELPSLLEAEGAPDTDVTVTVAPIDSSPLVPLHDPELPAYEYRSPEAVIESIDEPSASNLPPGVLAEHVADDDDDVDFAHREWATGGNKGGNARLSAMDVDLDSSAFAPAIPERPQIGPGVLARRWLEGLHPHHVYQPIITELPKPPLPKTPSRQPTLSDEVAGSPPSAGVGPSEPPAPLPTVPPLTLDDVFAALPGGKEHHHEWYFCPDCWGWLHVTMGSGDIPGILDMEAWEQKVELGSQLDREKSRTTRLEQLSRLKDIATSRSVPVKNQHHFHAFFNLIVPTAERHIDRVEPEGYKDAFSHLDLSYGEPPAELVKFKSFSNDAVLWVSCSSDAWVFIDQGPFPGQIPVGLVTDFTAEKKENPNVGVDRHQSVVDAWSLIITLLQNPLFRGNRGWVKLENKTFSSKIGASLRSWVYSHQGSSDISSHLLERVGFACKLEEEGYRVGPFAQGDLITGEHVAQMSAYMARTWVEVTLWLQHYQRQNGEYRWRLHG